MEDSQIAAALALQLSERIGAQRFEVWISSQTRLCVEATRLTIHAASDFVRDWIRKNLADDIRDVWQRLVGQAATVEFEVDREATGAAGDCSLSTKAEESARPIEVVEPQRQPTERPHAKPTSGVRKRGLKSDQSVVAAVSPRPEFALGDFVVGPSNEYAFHAAQLTASGRQQASPVLFHGATGTGKTHLLKAIAREYRRLNPRSMAVYLTAEQFTSSFIDAIRVSGLPSFRKKCRGANLLLVDDLQFFVGKGRTLEELQYTIDTVQAEGRQVVLASDRPIAALQTLGDELASRLAGGLSCEIAPPEYATRLQIARRISTELGLVLDEQALASVAANVNTGARELRGALNRLHVISLATGQPMTRELAESTIAEMARHCARTVKLADVQKVVCDTFGIEPADLRSERKGRTISEPRILAMWLARKYTRAAWSDIAQFFGRRSHSTVISAHRRVEKLISTKGQIGMSNRECGVEEAIRRLEAALRTA